MNIAFLFRCFALLGALFIAGGQVLVAQEIVFSAAQRFANQISEYDVAGRTEQGVLLHKWGSHYSVVEVLDERDLSVKWSKEVRIADKPRAQVRYLAALRNEVVIFYTVKQKRHQYLYAQIVDSRLEPIGEDRLIDSLRTDFGTPNLGWQFLLSPDRNQLGLLRSNASLNSLQSLTFMALSTGLDVQGKHTFMLDSKRSPAILKSYLSNEGEVWLCVGDKRVRASNTERYEDYTILAYRPEDNWMRQVDIKSPNDYSIGSLTFKHDYRNQRVVVAGFYSDRGRNSSAGFFRTYIENNADSASAYVFTPFHPDFIKQANRSHLVAQNELVNLAASDLIVRHDGGILLLGESYYTSQQTIMRSAFDSFSNRIPDQITSYYYNDMIALSANADGTEHWSRIIQKKQFSEDDGGYYASFAALNLKSVLHLIFNEDIRYDTQTSDCVLDAVTGEYRILSLPGNKQLNNILPAPRYARQLWANAVIFPAFTNRNEFLLAKISF